MGYAERVLQPGETIAYRARLHWIIYLAGMVLEAQTGLANGGLGFLAAFSLAATLLSPFVAAVGVRLNLAG